MFVKGLLRQSLNVESPQDLCNLTKTGAIEEDSSTKLKISSRDIFTIGWLDQLLKKSQAGHRCFTRSSVPNVVVSSKQRRVQPGHFLKSSENCR